jgi:dimeric dUTPase (all-alpha-NTP-PPase superfamily)
MKLNIEKLRQQQATLDARIFKQHDLLRHDTILDRMLALLVELGELANETRCFKYWSVRPASEMDVIAQEFSDGIHFLLSLGIDLEDTQQEIEALEVTSNLTDQFLACFEAVIDLSRQYDLYRYQKAFAYYLGLASKIGLDGETITNHYLKKNETNHQRQDENY